MSSRGSTAPSGSESAVANAKKQRLTSKLIEKVLQYYQEMGGPRLGITGRALMIAQVEAAIMQGNLKAANLRLIAHKVKEAQSAENTELGRPNTSSSHRQESLSVPNRLPTPLHRPSSASRRPPTSGSRPSTSGGIKLPPAIPPSLAAVAPDSKLTSSKAVSEATNAEAKQESNEEPKEASSETKEEAKEESGAAAGDVNFWDQEVPVPPDATVLLQPSVTLLSPLERRRNEKLSNSEWDTKINSEIREYQKEVLNTRKNRNEFQSQTRSALDEQCHQNEMLRQQCRDADHQFFSSEAEKRRKWEEQNREDEKTRREMRRLERETLKAQMQSREEDKKAAENQRKQEEQDYASSVAKEYVQSKLEDAHKKERTKQEFLAFLRYNNEQSELKRQAKQKEMDEDRRFLQEYTEYLDAQEHAYHEGLRKIAEKQHRIQVTAQSGYFKDLWQMQQADADRAARIQAQHEAQLLEDERLRKVRVKQRNDEMRQVLDRQLQEKEERKQAEIAEALQRRRQIDREVSEAQEATRQEKLQEAQQRAGRAKDLQRQVLENILKARKPAKVKIMGVS